jgi:hypothetical protein
VLGELQETITVTARPSDIAVETRSMGVGGVIERERILELPLPARNVTNLINMAGAAVTAGTRWWRPRANMVDRARGSALPRARQRDATTQSMKKCCLVVSVDAPISTAQTTAPTRHARCSSSMASAQIRVLAT